MIRVGVLRGGTGAQYERSLASGAHVLKHLPRDRYEVLDIYIDQAGVWHLGGIPVSTDKLRHRVDVIWNTLQGFYGEDGKLAQALETLGIPYTGSGPLASAVAMNKKLTKDRLLATGVKTPRGIYVEEWGTGSGDVAVAEVARTVSAKFSPPWIVEPISRGAGDGAMLAKTRGDLVEILQAVCEAKLPVLVEEAVLGTQAHVIALSGFRGQSVYTFLPMHAEGKEKKFQRVEKEQLETTAQKTHASLGLESYSLVHMVMDRKGAVSVLGVETVPTLHFEADLHHALAAVGSSFAEFADHFIRLALKKK